MTSPYGDIKQHFTQTFGEGGRLHIIRAPGRVNLIGEHTDYNDGFVFPMAIEPQVLMVCRNRDDSIVRLASQAFPASRTEFTLEHKIVPGEPTWANYSRGVAAELLSAGIPLTGMDLFIANTLPVGGGLSSSAALEVGTAICFLKLAGREMSRASLALLCQMAEQKFANVPCGIMDQMIVSSAEADHATLFDCRAMTKEYIPIDHNELRVVIINSMVKHSLKDGEYARRKEQCEAGVAFFKASQPQVKALRDISLPQLEAAQAQLPGVIYRRCRHVVSENARTVEAAGAIKAKHYEQAGRLMNESHDSLRDDYEVSCSELDFLAAHAVRVPGVYGARMTGGGFGGCIVALCRPDSVDTLTTEIIEVYEQKFSRKPAVFVTSATAAASAIE